jgi:tetratricopeptide (TPR) repeat protein
MNTTGREHLHRLVDHARRQIELENSGSACQLACRVLRIDPSDRVARLIHAEALLMLDRPAEALASLDAAELYAQEDADDEEAAAERLLLRALAERGQGRMNACREAVEQVLARCPRKPRLLERLGTLLISIGESARAITVIDKLLELRPADPDALRLAADAREAADQPEQALAIYEQMDRLRAGTGDSADQVERLRLARLRYRASQLAEASVAYDRLVEESDDPDLACEAGAVAVELGDDRRATTYLGKALQQRPRHDQALRMLAEQHMRCGRFAPAGRAWFRMLRMNPTDSRASAGLVVCAHCMQRTRLARRIEKRYRDSGRIDDHRRRAAQMWLSATPGRLLGRLWQPDLRSGHSGPLMTLLQESADAIAGELEGHREYADLHYHLSICHEMLHRPAEAGASLSHALHINRSYTQATRRKVLQLLRQQSHDAARAVLNAPEVRKNRELLDLAIAVDVLQGRIKRATSRMSSSELSLKRRHQLAQSVTELVAQFGAPGTAEAWTAAAPIAPEDETAHAKAA